MTTQEATETFTARITGMLNEKFGDRVKFHEINVKPEIDHDGDSYLHTYIIFEGDVAQIDPVWTVGLSGRMWPLAAELGFPSVPIQSFIEISEWIDIFKEGHLESQGPYTDS